MFMENHMKKILLYGLLVRSSKGTSWIPGEKGSQQVQVCNDASKMLTSRFYS